MSDEVVTPQVGILDETKQLSEGEKAALQHGEIIKKIIAAQTHQFEQNDRQARLAKLKRSVRVPTYNPETGNTRMALTTFVDDPSWKPSNEELRALVPLPQDSYNYIKLATNRHGLYAFPKQKGRRKPHMNQRNQEVRSASLVIFKGLFAKEDNLMRQGAQLAGLPYAGVPEESIDKLGTKSVQLAARQVLRSRRATRRRKNRMQQASRKVNVGILAGNQVNSYINHGGVYGR